MKTDEPADISDAQAAHAVGRDAAHLGDLADTLRDGSPQLADWTLAAEGLEPQPDFAESLIETAQAVVLVLDTQGRIVRFNSYMEELCGYTLAEVRGRDWFDVFVSDESRAESRKMFLKAVHDVHVWDSAGRIVTRYGIEREMEWRSKTMLNAEDAVVAVLSIGHDVTELKQAQEKLLRSERLAAVGQMVASLTHESRNALQQIQSCLELLSLEVQDRAKALQLVSRIQRAQDRLHRLFEDIRGYVAPIRLARERCDLRTVWQEAWSQLAPLRAGRVTQLIEQTRGLNLACSVDRFVLERVFRNILENSLAACPGELRATIECSEAEIGGWPALRVVVRDNGPGLSAEARQHIFEAFFTTKTRGTGLGMTIAKRIVEAHGGELAVGDTAGSGAEIIITLPRGGV